MPATFSGIDHDLLVRSDRAVGVLEERGIYLEPEELEARDDGPPFQQLGAIRLYRVGDLLAWGEEEQRRPKPAVAAVIHVHVHLPAPAASPRRRRRSVPIAEPTAA